MSRRRPESAAGIITLVTGVMCFLCVCAGTWQFELLRSALTHQAALADAAYAERDRLLQLVNEETGVRGYVATREPVFLDIYERSLPIASRDSTLMERSAATLPFLRPLISRSVRHQQRVQGYLRSEVALVTIDKVAAARANLRQGKTLFDRLRATDTVVQRTAYAAVLAQRQQTRLAADVGFWGGIALLFALILLLVGFGFVLRRSRTYRMSSLRDGLTGALNRSGAFARIDEEIARMQPFALVFIDLDDFKPVNDSYGHAAGDAVLQNVVSRLEHSIREEDAICRLGGDEFLCILTGPIHAAEVGQIVQRLEQVIHSPHEVAGNAIRVRCSGGVSLYPHDGATAEQLMSRADQAMYQAKVAGGGISEFTEACAR